MADSASAAPLGGTPRSVSSADMCVSAPFWAIDCAKRTITRIQNTRDVRPSRTETPSSTVAPPAIGPDALE